MEMVQSQRHKRDSQHGAKLDCGAKKHAARNKNKYLIIKCAAKRRRDEKRNRCKAGKHMHTKNAAITSQFNKSAPKLQVALLTQQLN